uniref:B-cell receptor CD22 n=1 Tax=Scophthalmus maximus TaxID=52904 RepID=A0A8D2ZU53_SCOMX
MRMDAQTVCCLIFLALMKNFSTAAILPFKLEPAKLTAKEGSCIEIKCQVTGTVDDGGAYWFWMKDAQWDVIKNDYNATVIYSTNNSERPVDPDFVKRVTYIGSPSLKYNGNPSPKPLCSISIRDLKKNDSGEYSFRFVGQNTWHTKSSSNLIVEENQCPLTFEQPPAVFESRTLTLTCSTSSSCPSNLRIQDLTSLHPTHIPDTHPNEKRTSVSFVASWMDDGKVFSCQTQDNMDKHLIRNISISVEYAPKLILAEGPKDVKEGDSVTLTCSAKGNPPPSLSWFKGEQMQSSEAEWKITSIEDSQRGNYCCKAQNSLGTITSGPVDINVKYPPQAEINILSPVSAVKHGNNITVTNTIQLTLTCIVRRSNPQPRTYTWLKGGITVGNEKTYVVGRIEPKDCGSYTCTATNTVGTGSSAPIQLDVQYRPRKTSISVRGFPDYEVKVGSILTFTCNTDANPPPTTYSWQRSNNNKPADSSQWNSISANRHQHYIYSVQRGDEGCYRCSASNPLGKGNNSVLVCIQVLYPPTKQTLSMAAEVTEGQTITIDCTVESFPQSTLTLSRTPASSPLNPQSLELTRHDMHAHPINALHHTFNVTSNDAGSYICRATNSEGSSTSQQRKLVVKYSPKSVTVRAAPGLVVIENTSLTLSCVAQSYPSVTSVTWMKMTDGKDETIQQSMTFTVNSVGPSDSGLYSCAASNGIGTGKSKGAEVEVKYAPKHTDITRAAEKQEREGRSSVALSCSSRSYPPVTHYSWYKKIQGEQKDKLVSKHQNHTVYSNQPGVYYCVAKNEINQRSSDPVHLFKRDHMQILKFFFLGLIIVLFIIFLIVLVYRYKRKKTIQQETVNTQLLFGFSGWCNGVRRENRRNETLLAEPCRSRDDLSQEQSCRPRAQRHQPPPDSTPASNILSVYCTVNVPQAPTAQNPTRQQGGQTEGDSVNYASLHFRNKPTNKHEADAVYEKVSKPTKTKKNEQESLQDYENISVAHAATSPNGWNDDTDTSDGEMELNYSLVSFKANPGHRRADRDSSSSDEDKIQYSDVKI